MKIDRFKIVILSFLFLNVSGCATIKHADQLLTLKSVGNSQEEIARYVDKQAELFKKLVEDIKDERLEIGEPKDNILSWYGEPVLSKEILGDSFVKEELLYRHPTEYFTSDRVYLYFDIADELVRWEYESGQ